MENTTAERKVLWNGILDVPLQKLVMIERVRQNCELAKLIPRDMPLQNVNRSYLSENETENESEDSDDPQVLLTIESGDGKKYASITDGGGATLSEWTRFYNANQRFYDAIEDEIRYNEISDTDMVTKDPVYQILEMRRAGDRSLYTALLRRQLDEPAYTAILVEKDFLSRGDISMKLQEDKLEEIEKEFSKRQKRKLLETEETLKNMVDDATKTRGNL